MTKYRKEKTGVDRFSLRQAVIFICATNRPDELDLEFVRSGRIDRRLYIGLPDAKQRVQIFGVHSAGKQLAEDVDFGKVSDWYYLFLISLLWLHFRGTQQLIYHIRKSTLIRLAIQSLTVLQLETQSTIMSAQDRSIF